jgi:hypothetical protein
MTDAQESSCKFGLAFGKGSKAQNLKSIASHRGMGTSKIPKYEKIHTNISDARRVSEGYPFN